MRRSRGTKEERGQESERSSSPRNRKTERRKDRDLHLHLLNVSSTSADGKHNNNKVDDNRRADCEGR